MKALRIISTLWPAALAAAVGPASAQTHSEQPVPPPPPPRSLTVTTSASVGEIFTDNARLVATDRDSDAITRATAGIRIRSNGARLKGFLDYSLTRLEYDRESDLSSTQNALNALATLQVVEQLAFLDVGGRIDRVPVSAFGTRPGDPLLTSPNITEARSFEISPHLDGRLGSTAEFEARVRYGSTVTDESSAFDQQTRSALFRLVSGRALARFNWRLEAFRQGVEQQDGVESKESRVRGDLTFSPDGEFAVAAIAGHESSDLLTGQKEDHSMSGWRVAWVPSPRTNLSFERSHRFFGDAHSINLFQRGPRWAWNYVDVKDLSLGFQPIFGTRGAIYELFFQQFASAERDPIRREALVNAYLESLGMSASGPLLHGSLTTAGRRTRQQQLSLAWLGPRTALTVIGFRIDSKRIESIVPTRGDFNATPQVREYGVGTSLAHRLTPLTALNAVAMRQRAVGTQSSQAGTLKSLVLRLASRAGRHTTISLAGRYATFDSPIEPYKERALMANLGVQF